MYQPQTRAFQMSDDNPNHRKMLKLRLRDSKLGETATPTKPNPDSKRSIRKEDQMFDTTIANNKAKKDMKAAEERGEVWEPNHKLRK